MFGKGHITQAPEKRELSSLFSLVNKTMSEVKLTVKFYS